MKRTGCQEFQSCLGAIIYVSLTLEPASSDSRMRLWEQARSEVGAGHVFKLKAAALKRSKDCWSVNTETMNNLLSHKAEGNTQAESSCSSRVEAAYNQGSCKFPHAGRGVKLTSSGGHGAQIWEVKMSSVALLSISPI